MMSKYKVKSNMNTRQLTTNIAIKSRDLQIKLLQSKANQHKVIIGGSAL